MRDDLIQLILQMTKTGITYSEAVREFKKLFLKQILIDYHGNQCAAARALGMHRNTLSRTLVELKMEAKIGRGDTSRMMPTAEARKHLAERRA